MKIPSVQPGDIRLAAIDFTLCAHFQSKNYPGIVAGYTSFAKPTGSYFNIQTEQSRITISHVPYRESFPPHAEFRKSAREENKPYLFASMEAERKRLEAEESDMLLKKHVLITYGDQNLEFLHIGMQLPGSRQAWMEPPVDLLKGLHLVDGEDDAEAKEPKIPMGMKEQFIQHLSENAEK